MMPVISRLMVKIALLHLLVGVLIGTFMLVQKAYPIWEPIWILRPIHIEMLIFGFIIQFTLGTAYWMLPKMLGDSQRGPELPAWIMVFALNLGIVLLLGKPVVNWFLMGEETHTTLTMIMGVSGRALQLTAVAIFVALHWNRVVTYRFLEHSH
jgi:cbb3-type cytochrome oxidase subunit 1